MDKKIYESKTMWIGIMAIVYSIYLLATTGEIDPQIVLQFLTGAGFMTLRSSIK